MNYLSLDRSRALPRIAFWLVAAMAAGALGADCQGNVVNDPTFRDWCGGSLCSWTLDSGRIQRVPTWNREDFGVSLLDTGTQISQATQEHDASCLLFTTVADIDPSAQMSILVDFNNDGTIDFQGPLGATDWHQVQAEITAPKSYSGITFHLRKEGSGTAVLAEMRVVSTDGCAAPAAHAPFLLGESCAATTDCAAGLVCTTDGVCAQCSEIAPCPDGVACEMRAFRASQCGPGQRLGKSGDPCMLPEDCASGACDGSSVTSIAAVFGQTDAGCQTAPPQCDIDASLDSGSSVCACYLTHGGTCR
jgi:hypothetical protein